MPPPIPLYTFDYKGKTEMRGVTETRSGMFFAEVPLKPFSKVSVSDQLEFGKVVYGPARVTVDEARKDHDLLHAAAHAGPMELRRLIARLSPLGGTRSYPNPAVWPVQAGAPKIHVQVSHEFDGEIRGVRRSNVSCSLPMGAPELLMERVVDVISDLLSCAVDSQLGLRPSIEDLFAAVRFALTREGGACPISDNVAEKFVVPLIREMRQMEPWSILRDSDPATDDSEVIHCFLLQFLDKARRADELGERKQLKRFRKEIRMRKKQAHTVFIKNLPLDVTEEQVFSLFNSLAPNAVYKVDLPRTDSGDSKGYGFVICRSRKATEAVLSKCNWELNGRVLFLAPRDDDSSPRKHMVSLPSELQDAVLRVVRQHPGCNASQVPNFVQILSPSLSLNPHRFGFRNLTQALQSISQIYLEHANRGNANRPVYFVYPK